MTKGLVFWAIVFGLVLACSSQQPKAIVVSPSPSAPPGSGSGGGFQGAPGGNNATFQTQIPKGVEKYVGGATFSYQLTYLGVTVDGASTVNGNAADISVSNLPSGQTGNLTLKLFDQSSSTLKLSGTSPSVTLQPGS